VSGKNPFAACQLGEFAVVQLPLPNGTPAGHASNSARTRPLPAGWLARNSAAKPDSLPTGQRPSTRVDPEEPREVVAHDCAHLIVRKAA
jgi:hypothetical protein